MKPQAPSCAPGLEVHPCDQKFKVIPFFMSSSVGNVRPKKWGGRKRIEGRFKRLLTVSLVKSDSLDAKDLGCRSMGKKNGSWPGTGCSWVWDIADAMGSGSL